MPSAHGEVPMHRLLLSCSNCDQGAADRYWWLAGIAVVSSVIAGVVLLVRLRSSNFRTRVLGVLVVAVLALGIVLSLSTLAAGVRETVEGSTVSCGSALTSAKMRGVPNDAALDPVQRGCRRAGRQHLRDELPVPLSIAAVGLLATLAGLGRSVQRPARLPLTDQAEPSAAEVSRRR